MEHLDISEERMRELRKLIPRGEYYPKTYRKGQLRTKTSYYVAPVQIPVDAVHPYDTQNFATRLVAGMPNGPTLQSQQEYWERALLGAFYHLYGADWFQWTFIIPWLGRGQIEQRAVAFGCERPWTWMEKRHFLKEHGFNWSLDDLNYLIDRYPERQMDERAQGIYVGNKPFAEILRVATALQLPTRAVLGTLAGYASRLNNR